MGQLIKMHDPEPELVYFRRLLVESDGLSWECGDDPHNEYIRAHTFRLMQEPYHADGLEEAGPEREIGRIQVSHFLYGRTVNEETCIIDAADSESATSYAVAETLFHERAGIRCWMEEELDVYDAYDALWVHSIWLEPDVRGQGLGQQFLCRAIDWFDTSSLFAMVLEPAADAFFRDTKCPHPRWPKPAADDPYRERALTFEGQRRLLSWYKSMGFEQWEDGPFWWRELYSYSSKRQLTRDAKLLPTNKRHSAQPK